jgi:hypothetical protein
MVPREHDCAAVVQPRKKAADGSATVVWSLPTVHHWMDVTAGLAGVQQLLGNSYYCVDPHGRP